MIRLSYVFSHHTPYKVSVASEFLIAVDGTKEIIVQNVVGPKDISVRLPAAAGAGCRCGERERRLSAAYYAIRQCVLELCLAFVGDLRVVTEDQQSELGQTCKFCQPRIRYLSIV